MAAFFREAAAAFHFLESQYGYQRLEKLVESPDDERDLLALLRYVGPSIGVEVSWYPASAAISVSLAEAREPFVYPKDRLFVLHSGLDAPRAINLESLAGAQGHTDDPDFLLGLYRGDAYFRKTKQRAQLIQARLPDVLAGLARATQTYAAAVLNGDTSDFPAAMAYYATVMNMG